MSELISPTNRNEELRARYSALSETVAERVVLFEQVLETVLRQDVVLVILHGHEHLRTEIPSDVDCACRDPHLVLQCLQEATDISVIHVLEHQKGAYRILLTRRQRGSVSLALDVSRDFRRNGAIYFSGDELHSNTRIVSGMHVLTFPYEFGYYLTKKIAKQDLTFDQAKTLIRLFRRDRNGADTMVRRFLPKKEARAILDALSNGDDRLLCRKIPMLYGAMFRRLTVRRPIAALRYWGGELHRCWNRARDPKGLFLAFYGPDGSGKSTVIDTVSRDLAAAFHGVDRYHLRPYMLARLGPGGPVNRPHAFAPHRRAKSYLKLGVWGLDYVLAYWLRIFLRLIRNRLVIFDRYYHDIEVDPKRYRYGGGLLFSQMIGRALPQPDLSVFLDVPADEIQARKSEVSPEESARQQMAYRNLASRTRGAVVVDGSGSPNQVRILVEQAIFEFLENRETRKPLYRKDSTEVWR